VCVSECMQERVCRSVCVSVCAGVCLSVCKKNKIRPVNGQKNKKKDLVFWK
jgi:hypothetical protein